MKFIRSAYMMLDTKNRQSVTRKKCIFAAGTQERTAAQRIQELLFPLIILIVNYLVDRKEGNPVVQEMKGIYPNLFSMA